MSYEWFFIIIFLMLLAAISTRYIPLWAKALIGVYYGIVAILFITLTNRINRKYEGITPVPNAYWTENSSWVYTVSNLLFLPFIGILIFIYFNWIAKVRSKMAKALIVLSLIPVAFIVFIFYFFFNLAYGYRP
ncbi:hypothetical protein HU147_09885 [Planomicrobium chinense]|uniref:hypothetical protein n=1 Tax=Planococcus chinensis TaxID=272917 RepID=UPI001CC64260|nr:hypothetical protein [Planococcus chinensis]MBZ5201524.1 hypothetical protein [Planococcus chinensis]